jgi:hypothetical protein
MSAIRKRTDNNVTSVRVLRLQSCYLSDEDTSTLEAVVERLPACEEVDIGWNRMLGTTELTRNMLLRLLGRCRGWAVGVSGLLDKCGDDHLTFTQELAKAGKWEELSRLIWLPRGVASDLIWMIGDDARALQIVRDAHDDYYGPSSDDDD